jgi:hypothetical protein
MAHNGGRYQSQLGLPSNSGQWPFMNKIKMATYWSLGASGRLLASNINANGYPTSAANNPALTIDDEGGTFRPGQRVLVWEGASTFTCSGATVHAGSSLTGVSGTNRAVMNLSNDTSPKTITLTLQSTDGALDNMRWLHIDDESSYNSQKLADPNKEPFGTKFLEVTQALNLGVMRFLDPQLGNASNVCNWAHRTPVSHFSYVASQFPPSVFGGAAGGTTSALTGTVSGFSLTDGAVVILDFPVAATLTVGSPTLNISGTGAKPMKLPNGLPWVKAFSNCTISNASPGVVTLSNSLTANTPIVFTAGSGTLPTELVAGTIYYVHATGLSSTAFTVSATPGGAQINTSGGSGTVRITLPTTTPRRGTFTYVALLDAYVGTAVYDLGGRDFDEGIMAGWPPEVMLDLCNILQCHGHFVPPFLACDTPSDYVPSFAALAASTLNSGLQFRMEGGPNECWNFLFWSTEHAQECALVRYGVTNQDDWYGRSCSLLGAAIQSAFSSDRTRYAVICGFQTTSSPDNVAGTNTSRRIESTRHVSVSGGNPAKNYLTHICMANYWNTMAGFANSVGTSNERYLRMVSYVAKARDWTNGNAAAKLALIEAQFEESAVEDWMVSEMDVRLARWKAVADNYTVFGTAEPFKLTFYEGGYYPGDIDSDPTHGIDGVTLGNPTIITINQINATQAHAFQTGMRARFRGIGGTTQLNGNTYDVLDADATTVTIDVDSTAFGTFTSGGSGTFGYTTTLTNGIIYDGYGNTGAQTLAAFQAATKAAESILYGTQKVLQRCAAVGEYPSDFYLYGGIAVVQSLRQWAKYDTLYATPSPQVDAMILFNNRLRRKRLTATP